MSISLFLQSLEIRESLSRLTVLLNLSLEHLATTIYRLIMFDNLTFTIIISDRTVFSRRGRKKEKKKKGKVHTGCPSMILRSVPLSFSDLDAPRRAAAGIMQWPKASSTSTLHRWRRNFSAQVYGAVDCALWNERQSLTTRKLSDPIPNNVFISFYS